MWSILIPLAFAAPPSSTLTGDAGTLSWTVAPAAAGLVIDGKSPKWTVHHECGADFTPKATERTGADGAVTRITYDATGATVKLPSGEIRVDQAGLWDGDILDIRLGAWSAGHTQDLAFSAIDSGSGTVYGFSARYQGDQTHGGGACRAWRVQLSGFYRLVGPTWDYCFANDGKLVWFSGPIGVYEIAH